MVFWPVLPDSNFADIEFPAGQNILLKAAAGGTIPIMFYDRIFPAAVAAAGQGGNLLNNQLCSDK